MKDAIISLRLDLETASRLGDAAKRYAQSRSDYIRLLLVSALYQAEPVPPTITRHTFRCGHFSAGRALWVQCGHGCEMQTNP